MCFETCSVKNLILQKRRKEELEKRLQDDQEEDITEEEKKKREIESDIKLAIETTFGGTATPITGLDGFNPNTKEEFDEFANVLEKKLQPLSQSAEYPAFSENVIRSLCAPRKSNYGNIFHKQVILLRLQ